tara:strand:+ start:10423 stop:10689 length:267 start_codon:yes stop_codon:yes gene_type:complete
VTKIDIDEDDLIIKRVSNGWLVKSLSEHDSNYLFRKVFEDSDGTFNIAAANSLRNLIYECFDSYIQGKRCPGLVIDIKQKGWSEENES